MNSRAMHLRHLQEVERWVAEGERHISEQEQRIATLRREGHDVTQAESLLQVFYQTQQAATMSVLPNCRCLSK